MREIYNLFDDQNQGAFAVREFAEVLKRLGSVEQDKVEGGYKHS